MLRSGDSAPDVILAEISGRRVSLAETWADGNIGLLIFLRHLG